jgi:ectoine hydroxylase
MKLSNVQLNQFEEQGFLLLQNCLSAPEIATIRSQIPPLISADSEACVFEEDSNAVRAIHGCHKENDVMRYLTMHPRILEPTLQILQSDAYVYQFKINLKAPFDGGAWPWHQDFKHWHEEDGLPLPQIMSAAIYLDEVNEFNGPIFVIPGSHKEGVYETMELESSGWKKKHRADLKYVLNRSVVSALVKKNGIVSTEGPEGSLLFFHSLVAHGSASNICPFNRWVLIITYNSIHNKPVPKGEPRAGFLVGRDYTPLHPLTLDSHRI